MRKTASFAISLCSNERLVRTNLPQAKVVVFNDNGIIERTVAKGLK